MKHRRIFFALFGISAFLGAALGFLTITQTVEANIFEDLWRGITAPFGFLEQTSTPPAANIPQPPPPYKPTVDYEKAVVDAVKRASPAVVSVTVSKNVPIIENCQIDPFGDLPPEFRQFFGDVPRLSQPCERGSELREVGSGSGFIISSDGLIITNKHVVLDKNASYTVFTNDGKKYDATVLARDPVQDLAVLRISAAGLHTVVLGDSDALELGQSAIAIGNALGEFRNTVSVGVVSGLARNVTASGGGLTEEIQGVIQTDAAINPGNSGGPLLNLRGEVIGINTAVASGAQNIGFAIPINKAKRDIESVKRSGEIQVPFLGVRYVLLTPELAQREKLPAEYGALLRGSKDGPAVAPRSPAADAGLQAEDIIVAINGERITKDRGLAEIISQFSVGETVVILINRGGQERTLRATLVKRSEE